MRTCWKILFLGFLTSSSACRSEVTPEVSGDLGVATLLSDGAVLGTVVASSTAGDAPGFISGHITVSGQHVEDILFENIPSESLSECDRAKCVVLYNRTPVGKALTQSPWPSLFRDESIYRAFNSIRKASNDKVTSVLRKDHCSVEMKTLLDQLDGDNQQSSVDTLFSRTLSKEDRLCLASQVSSLARLTRSSFAPPYASSEGVYHHGFPTRGDLIAFLLPHLTKMTMVPTTFPLSVTDRERMTAAWVYAMSSGN